MAEPREKAAFAAPAGQAALTGFAPGGADTGRAAPADAAPVALGEQRALDFVMEAGRTLLENGAEVFRVQQTMEIMAKSLGIEAFGVYVLTNGIFASAGQQGEVRYLPGAQVHLGRVERLNALSREIAAGGVDLDTAFARLRAIQALPAAPALAQLLACAVGSGCFALLFGGTMPEALAAFAVGLALQGMLLWANRAGMNKIVTKMGGAALVALTALCARALLPGLQTGLVIIGGLMPLTPGISLTMAIRDFVNSDYLSGAIRLLDALLIAGFLACGVGIVLGLARVWLGVTV